RRRAKPPDSAGYRTAMNFGAATGRAFLLPLTARTNVLFQRSGNNVMLGVKQVRKPGETHDSCRVGATQRHVLARGSHKRRVGIMRCNNGGSRSAPPTATKRRPNRQSGEFVAAPRCCPYRPDRATALRASRRTDVAG